MSPHCYYCFLPDKADEQRSSYSSTGPLPQPHQVHDDANLTTCLYHTYLGILALTWSRTRFGRSLHLHLNLHPQTHQGRAFEYSPSSPTLSFHLHMNYFFFWKKRGSKKLRIDCGGGNDPCSNAAHLFWDLTRAKFGSGPEPVSEFYVTVVVDGELGLLDGDLEKLAYSRTRVMGSEKSASQQALFLRREHVFGNGVYHLTARIGEKERSILVDCNVIGDGKLNFCVEKKRVLQVKRLKWKFPGNERVEFDGIRFQVSWDVYNWLFEDASDGHVVFMLRFDKQDDGQEDGRSSKANDKDNVLTNSHNASSSSFSFGMNEIELRKMLKSMPRTARSSSMSWSASSCGSNSSVMEWASTEENELTGPVGFSLLVYAWRR